MEGTASPRRARAPRAPGARLAASRLAVSRPREARAPRLAKAPAARMRKPRRRAATCGSLRGALASPRRRGAAVGVTSLAGCGNPVAGRHGPLQTADTRPRNAARRRMRTRMQRTGKAMRATSWLRGAQRPCTCCADFGGQGTLPGTLQVANDRLHDAQLVCRRQVLGSTISPSSVQD